jgi:hypothetical protein
MKELVGNLTAEISVTELRDQDLLNERLLRHHAVRVRRRGEIIGVLLDTDLWTSLLDQLSRLQSANERYEDDAALALIAARSNEAFLPATDETIDRIFTEFEATVRERSATE